MKRRSMKRLTAAALALLMAVSGSGLQVLANSDAAVNENADESADAAILPEDPAYPYLDTGLSFEERAADLVSRMTLEEKAAQLVNNAPAIPRLGVREHQWSNEALHGIWNWNGEANGSVGEPAGATSYPISLSLASTWDPELIYEITSAISDEGRGYAEEVGKPLSYWSPTINLARDPRWGRNAESYGEDTYLTSQIGDSFVRGLQGDDETYLKSIATIKHFAANDSEYNRHTGSSDMDERTLREYYTKSFKDIVESADVQSVMSSYNKINGTPSSVNSTLLDTMLRRSWGFSGYIVSDCGAIDDVYVGHQWQPEDMSRPVNAVEATAYAIKAGTDLNCGTTYNANAVTAVNRGLLSEDDIDIALVRLFTARMKTGEFDPDYMVSYRSEEYTFENQVGAKDHTLLAEEAAKETVVLLRNEAAKGETDPILPLDAAENDNIVIVGSLADDVLLGQYSGKPYEQNKTSPLEGITEVLKAQNPNARITYISGVEGDDYKDYVMNVLNIDLVKTNGSTQTIPASAFDEFSRCQLENNNNVGFALPDGYVKISQVDMTNVKSIVVRAAGDSRDSIMGYVEVHVGSPTGPLAANITTQSSGGWQDYSPFSGTYTHPQDTAIVQDIYLVFRPYDLTLTAAQKNQIMNADTVIAYLGTQDYDSGEENDRADVIFPRRQSGLARQLAELNPRTVVYMQTVGQVDIEEFRNEVPAILWCCYNGQAQGKAAGSLLFGEANPSGKLTFTWYQDGNELPGISDYTIRSSEDYIGRTYQYFTGKVTYPFGYGLSYSTFEYSNVTVDKNTVTPNDTIQVTVDVENTSDIDGEEIVQLYVVSPGADKVDRPAKRLKGFEKVALAAGEKKTVTLTLDIADLYYWDEDAAKEIYDEGEYIIQLGSSSDDIRLEKSFTLSGERDVELSVVTATPDKISLDAAKPNRKANTILTAAMNDETFIDLEKAEVVYRSSNEKVATVDEKGVVTPVSGGTAVITVSVTVDGVTKSDSYAVSVADDFTVTNILIDGKSYKGFDTDIYQYFYEPEGNVLPTISVKTDRDDVAVEISQAVSIPGVAVVKATVGEVSKVYRIYMIEEGEVDDFTTGNLGDWKIIKEDSSRWMLDSNGLTITTQEGDLINQTTTYKNVFVKDTPDNWIMETELNFSRAPYQPFHQGGIMAFQDEDSYVKLDCEYSDSGVIVQLFSEQDQKYTNVAYDYFSKTKIYLRLAKINDTYVGYYSSDGVNYTPVGKCVNYLNDPQAALIATNSAAGIPSIGVTYKYVEITDLSKQGVPVLPYVDVAKTDWFYDGVYFNYFARTMTGLDDTHFGPYESLSRAQFALMLYRIEGTPEVTSENPFKDIVGNEWYAKAVLWAQANGIVTGYQDGNFGPADMITREQMAVMMYRYAKYLDEDTTVGAELDTFADASNVSGFAAEAMQWAVGNGIITGKESGTKLDPQGNTARAEAALIIQRFMEK